MHHHATRRRGGRDDGEPSGDVAASDDDDAVRARLRGTGWIAWAPLALGALAIAVTMWGALMWMGLGRSALAAAPVSAGSLTSGNAAPPRSVLRQATSGTSNPLACGGLPCSMRGAGRVPTASPEDRVVIPLPYGSDLDFPEAMARRALALGLSMEGAGEYQGLGRSGQHVTVERVIGGGVINAVFKCALENGKTVFLKLGSPFWRGCGKSMAEATVQRLVAERTSIPVPRVIAAQAARWVLRSDNRTLVDVMQADALGVPVRLDLPDFIIMEAAPGAKLKDVLRRPSEEVPVPTRRQLMKEWVGVFQQLRGLHFDAYGSFGPLGPEVGGLASNAGCSGLGPFSSYEAYAAARVEMFLPLLAGGACQGDRFAPYIPRLRCLARSFARSSTSPGGAPVLLHSDMSARNILVTTGGGGGGGGGGGDGSDNGFSISAVLDWEFAVSGPEEEEFTFDATLEGLTPADVALFRDVAKELGVSLETPSSRSRRDHIDAYYGLITFCHAHAWRDDPSFTDEVREQTLVEMERKMLQLMQRNGC